MTTKSKYPASQDLTPEQRLANNRLLINLVYVALGLLFACLIYANFMVRNAQNQWPPIGIDRMDMLPPILMTVILIASSGTAIFAMRALRQGKREAFIGGLAATAVLGVIYAVWMFITLGRILDGYYRLNTNVFNVYSAMFLALWFVHALHAIAVLGILGYVIQNARQNVYSIEKGYFPVEAGTHLWHFLTIVWIVLFVVLYLV